MVGDRLPAYATECEAVSLTSQTHQLSHQHEMGLLRDLKEKKAGHVGGSVG